MVGSPPRNGDSGQILFFFFFFNSSVFSIKPDPFKTRLKPVSVIKKNDPILDYINGAGRVPVGRGFIAIPNIEL